MPRVLPWKRIGAAAAAASSSSATPRSSTTPTRPIKTDPDPEAEAEASPAPSAASRKRSRHSRAHRSGSTSPPPEPLQESFMIEGLDNDDRYHMVEDELLATAQQFTAHLHAAEYQRLKEAAKSQNAAVIRQISRPVVGGMSRRVEKKQERAGLLRKQTAALRRGGAAGRQDDSDDDSDDAAAAAQNSALKGTSLYTLMASPRKQAPRLDRIASFSTATRAAAGFGASSGQSAESSRGPSLLSSSPTRRMNSVMDMDGDDSDDLDPSRRPRNIMNPTSKPSVRSNGNNNNKNRPRAHDPVPNTSMKRSSTTMKAVLPSTSGLSHATPPTTGKSRELSDDDSDNDPFGLQTRIKQRNTRDRKRAKTTEENRKNTSSSSKDIIPGFL